MHASSLKEDFYQSLDHSAVTSFIERICKIPEQERRNVEGFLGEGSHFQSFSLNSKPLPLAINVAKASFLAQGPSAISRWKNAVRDLRTIETQALVPPIECIQSLDQIALVMPQGRPMPGKMVSAQGLDQALNETSRALGKAGLVLDDYPQLVECRGRFFINDWSDLQCA